MTSLNRTASNWSAEERRKINENWERIEGNFTGVLNTVSQKAFDEVIDAARLTWQEPVNTFADLTISYPNAVEGWASWSREIENGVSKAYRFNGQQWVELQNFSSDAISEVDTRLNVEINKSKLEHIYISDYPRLSGESNDQPRFERALSYLKSISGGILNLESNTTYDVNSIKVPNNVTITGANYTTVLKQLPFEGHVIVNEISDSRNIKISNLMIDGNKANQTTRNHGIFITQGLNVDPEHNFRHLFIRNCSGIGLALVGRGEHRVENIFSIRNSGHGIYIGCSDSFFSNITCGFSGNSGIFLDGPNNKMVNIKAYTSGNVDDNSPGVLITQSRNIISNLEVQENSTHGVELTSGAHLNVISVITDANGYSSLNNAPKVGSYYGVAIGNNVHNNIINATGADFQKTNLNSAARQFGSLLIYGNDVSQNDINFKVYDLVENLSDLRTRLDSKLNDNKISITARKLDNTKFEYGNGVNLNRKASFTPRIASINAANITSDGYYVRNGETITVVGRIVINSPDGLTSTSGVFIEGLPFQALNFSGVSSISQNLIIRVLDETIPEPLIGGISNDGFGVSVQFNNGKADFLPINRLRVGTVINFSGTYILK